MNIEKFVEKYINAYNNWKQMEMTDEYYHENVVSIEPIKGRSTKSLTDKMERNKRYFSLNKNIRTRMLSPIISWRFFSVKYEMTANDSRDWKDIEFQEIWVFEVKNWKIIKEHFFYDPPQNLA